MGIKERITDGVFSRRRIRGQLWYVDPIQIRPLSKKEEEFSVHVLVRQPGGGYAPDRVIFQAGEAQKIVDNFENLRFSEVEIVSPGRFLVKRVPGEVRIISEPSTESNSNGV